MPWPSSASAPSSAFDASVTPSASAPTLATIATSGTTVAEAGAIDDSEGVGLIASAWRRLRRNPIFLLGLAITIAFVVLAIVAPWIAPHDPADNPLIDKVSPQSNPIPGPEAGYPLGADSSGRDFLSRLIVGSRQTLIVGVAATLGGLSGGLVLGTLAGAFGGVVDAVIMRIVDVMLSIPSLLLAFSIAPSSPDDRGYYAEAVAEHDVDVIAQPEIDITSGQDGGDVLVGIAHRVHGRVVVGGPDSVRPRGPQRPGGQAVPEEEVVTGGESLEATRLTGCVDADRVPEEGRDDRLVDRHPHRDPVGQPSGDESGVVAQALGGLAGHPAPLRLEGRRQVPVVERGEGSDPRLAQGVDRPVVEVEADRVGRAVTRRLDARPGDRKAVGIDTKAAQQVDVLVPAVVAVAGDGTRRPVGDRAGPVAEVVPDAAATTTGGHTPFDLVAGGRGADHEVTGHGLS